ncbi:MAG TPA: carbohydrate kinase family protein [Firmicutes bacterium]|nr:carbohydrate kinase family protein [Bacillota bacterium]
MPKVWCAGVLVADVLVRPLKDMPVKGRSTFVDNVEVHIGGCAIVTAIAFQKLGIDAGIMGGVGRDVFGDFVRGQVRAFGVDDRGLKVYPDMGTGTSIVLVDPEGERTFIATLGANGVYSERDIRLTVRCQ